MTLVDTHTGEVVDILDTHHAQMLCATIDRQTARVNVEAGKLVELIADALKGKAWVALGLGSWAELVEAKGWEFTPRTSTDRAALAQVLRESGMSYRAIGKLVGASKSQIERDVEGTVPNGTVPDTVIGVDGIERPATRPAPTVAELADDLASDELYDGEAEAIADTLAAADDAETIGAAIDEAIESRDPEPDTAPPITKPDLGGGISHPARYSDALLPIFESVLADDYELVLDPFAGTGRIHELPNQTIGIELEDEWANLHPGTIQGSALELPFPDCHFDAICTSPTYGNRLADHHQASDPERRRSYTHDLGRTLSPDNSGAMHWGDTYREFHEQAWSEAVRVLRHGGRFVLNIKDHIRDGVQQPVAAWHVATLTDLGLMFNAELSQGVPTRHLRQGSNTERAGQEMVLVFDRPSDFGSRCSTCGVKAD